MIRHATIRDIPRLVELGRELVQKTPNHRNAIEPNEEAISASLSVLIDNQHALALVYEAGGEVVGMIGILLTMHPFAGWAVANELFWYVTPEHRGPAGLRLLRCAEAWARENGAQQILVASPSKKVSSFFKRVGYRRIEEHFVKGLQEHK